MTNRKSIPKRSLGSSGIEVSAIGLGCMSLSGVYGASSDEDGIALIHEALDRGITLLDTSDMYGFGHNEELVGKAIKGRRSEVVLATKFGNLGGQGGKIADGRPEYVLSACEASLKRLGVEVIDLYYQHRIDPTVPVEDTVGAMAQLVREGKVRALGLSEARPGDHSPCPCRASDGSGAKRVLAALPDGSRGNAAHDPQARTSALSPIPRSAAAC